MRVPGTRKARPAPAVTERAWAEMPTGRGRWATAPLSGTSSGQTGPPPVPGDHPRGLRTPEHRSFRRVPSPCRFRRAPPVTSAGTSREDCGEPSRRQGLAAAEAAGWARRRTAAASRDRAERHDLPVTPVTDLASPGRYQYVDSNTAGRGEPVNDPMEPGGTHARWTFRRRWRHGGRLMTTWPGPGGRYVEVADILATDGAGRVRDGVRLRWQPAGRR